MIFVTVGHQTPFDRLIQWMDTWSESSGRSDVFAQIGNGEYVPRRFPHARFLGPAEFQRRMTEASAIVGHAGTGTIIDAARLRKPLLVVPRLASLNETRNDHQVPTARHFAKRGYVLTATSEVELDEVMARIESFRPSATMDGIAPPQIIQRLREFTFGVGSSAPS